MASLYKKVIHGRPYWYLREMGWVDGKPKMVSERYVGTAADIEALLDGRAQAMVPERCRHLDFGAVAAVWGLLTDLKVADLVDEAAGAAPSGQPLSTGTYLALAVLNRVVDPCSKRGFADWWRTTAADRFTKIGVSALDHRRFWDAMHAVPLDGLAGTEERLALAVCARYGLDTSSVALDMTNFATFIDTGNDRAPIAQRGRAKQKRTDLRLVGLGLVVTRDGGVPVVSHAYAGDRPDVTQFTAVIDRLLARYQDLTERVESLTVVYDAGQNSCDNHARIEQAGVGFVGSLAPSDHPGLLAIPRSRTTGPTRRSGSTSSTASWPWPSPICCAATPNRPACACRCANCWLRWPASRKPSCSTTTAAKAVPAPGASSPTAPQPSRPSTTCSLSTATPRPADLEERAHG